MKVAVIGAGGLLGQDVVQSAPSAYHVHSFHREIDITRRDIIKEKLIAVQPEWVINCSGYSNVDGAETEKEKAHHLNVLGPHNLAELCRQLNIRLIHGSTDYVFPSRTDAGFVETDIPQPMNEYGRTKWEGEKQVLTWEKSYILRLNSLYGWGRSNHATRVLDAVQSHQRIKVATDMRCSPSYTGDLARWIWDLIQKQPPFGIYHLSHSGSCSRYEFALELCRHLKISEPFPVDQIKVESLNLKAKRPYWPQLLTKKWEDIMGPLPTWQDGIANFLNDHKNT